MAAALAAVQATRSGYLEVEDDDIEEDFFEDKEDKPEISTVSLHVDVQEFQEFHNQDSPCGGTDSDNDDMSDFEEDDTLPTIGSRWRRCKRSGLCSLTLYLWIAIFVLGCLAALVVVGVLVVGPYQKAAGFKQVNCEPVGFQYQEEEHKCSCGKGCNSGYPCLKILVEYSGEQVVNPDARHQAVLHDNESSLDRQVSGVILIILKV